MFEELDDGYAPSHAQLQQTTIFEPPPVLVPPTATTSSSSQPLAVGQLPVEVHSLGLGPPPAIRDSIRRRVTPIPSESGQFTHPSDHTSDAGDPSPSELSDAPRAAPPAPSKRGKKKATGGRGRGKQRAT